VKRGARPLVVDVRDRAHCDLTHFEIGVEERE
jgi:hypothetical protein